MNQTCVGLRDDISDYHVVHSHLGRQRGRQGSHRVVSSWHRDRQEITWTFECPIAPHLGSLLNRKIRDVERLRLWFRSIGATQYGAHLDPKLSNLFLADPTVDSMMRHPSQGGAASLAIQPVGAYEIPPSYQAC